MYDDSWGLLEHGCQSLTVPGSFFTLHLSYVKDRFDWRIELSNARSERARVAADGKS